MGNIDYTMEKVHELSLSGHHDLAREILEEIAGGNSPEAGDAHFDLAYRYLNGWQGVEQNDQKALEHFTYAVIKGNENAAVKMLEIMDWDIAEAIKSSVLDAICSEAAKGNPNCVYFVGLQTEGEKGSEGALPYYEFASNRGIISALYRKSMHSDDIEAITRAAAAGNERAAYYLARHYEDIGCDPDKVFKYYYQVSLTEADAAAYHLAFCYENGIGTEPDEKKAFDLYYTAIENDTYLMEDLFEDISEFNENGVQELYAHANLFVGKYLSKHPEHNEYSKAIDYLEEAYNNLRFGTDNCLEAAYLIGVGKLFGIWEEYEETALEYIEEAANGGHYEAKQLLKAIEERRELIDSLADIEVTEAQQRDEALCRLRLLEKKGFTGEAAEIFEAGSIPCGSDDVMGVSPFEPQYVPDDTYDLIKSEIDSAKRNGLLIYYIHQSLTLDSHYANLFFVSKDSFDWSEDCTSIIEGRPYVACADLRQGGYLITSIGIDIEKGSISRWF